MDSPLPARLGQFLGRIIRPHRAGVAYILFCPVMLAVENTTMPYALRLLVDGLSAIAATPERAWAVARGPIALYIGLLVAMLGVFRLREWLLRSLQPRIMAEIRLQLFDHTTLHSHRFFADHFAGALGAKINDVARAIDSVKDFFCWRVVPFIAMTSITTAMIAPIAWPLSVIILGWIAAHLLLSYLLGKRVDRSAALNAEDRSQLAGALVDSVGNIPVVRLFARRVHERRVIGEFQQREIQSFRRALTDIFISRAVVDLLIVAMYLLVFFALINGWRGGAISLGDMVFILFTTFFVVEYTWLMTAEMPQAFFSIGTARQGYATLSAAHEIVDAPDARPLSVRRGEITVTGMHFRYGTQPPLFHDLTLTIPAGQKVGLVGFSGSGKTTFAHLLLRFYDVSAGHIRIDGQDIAAVTQDSLREQIAFIPQDATLFHRSLMDNIRYGRLEASDAEVYAAARAADCDHFIARLPQGYATLVGERGIKLSGGQRQRIAIARAFLKNAPILLLDEATSALDSVTESAIQQALAQLMEGRTTIVIAHRLSTLARMERILVFDGGRIIEEGSHATLLAQNGHYARMWRMQAGGFLPE